MKALIKDLYYNTRWGHLIISIPKYFYNLIIYKLLPLLPEKMFLQIMFGIRFGYKLNLKNPKTLNEKIQWLKLNDRTNLHTLCADKLAVRDYIKEKIGEEYLIPLVYATDKADEITLDKLPEYPVIIKTNHGSGGAIIVKDKRLVSTTRIQKDLKKQLKKNLYFITKEWQYKNIKPKILIEKLLVDEMGKIPMDYKFHCFHGKVEAIHVDIDRFTDHKRNLYDTQWNLLPFSWAYNTSHKAIAKPEVLDRMIGIAEHLSQPFMYVRVDLYLIRNKIYFGELTFHTESGWGKFTPQGFDKILGDSMNHKLIML
jgi:hypothetical protein